MTSYRYNVVRRTVLARQMAAAEAYTAEMRREFRALEMQHFLRGLPMWTAIAAIITMPLWLAPLLGF